MPSEADAAMAEPGESVPGSKSRLNSASKVAQRGLPNDYGLDELRWSDGLDQTRPAQLACV
jgi:hypothetical protein